MDHGTRSLERAISTKRTGLISAGERQQEVVQFLEKKKQRRRHLFIRTQVQSSLGFRRLPFNMLGVNPLAANPYSRKWYQGLFDPIPWSG